MPKNTPCVAHYDLGQDMQPCLGEIKLCDELLTMQDGDNVRTIPISTVQTLTLLPQVGCAVLFYKSKGENPTETVLCRFTMRYMREMSEFCKVVNYYLETQVLSSMEQNTTRLCEKCGKPLMEGLNFCVFCLNKKEIFGRIVALAKPFIGAILVSAFFFTVVQLLHVVGPVLSRILIDDYLRPQTGTPVQILSLVGIMLLTRVVMQTIFIFTSRRFNKVSAAIANHLRNLAFEKVQALSMTSLAKRTSGDLMRRVMEDSQVIRDFLSDRTREVFEQCVVFIVVGIILFVASPLLALLILIPIPIVLMIMAWFWKKINLRFYRQWRLTSRSNAILHDIIKGIRVVKAFGNDQKEVEKFGKACEEVAEVSSDNEKMWARLFPSVTFVIGLGEFFVLYFGGQAVLGHSLSLGELVQYTMYLAILYGPLRWMANYPRMVAQAMTSLAKLFEIIDEVSDVPDTQLPQDQEIKGHIAFEGVHFGYKAHEPVLQDISLNIEPGEMVGIVGHSGVGKSTLINLILRLYDVNRGNIYMDGVKIGDMSKKHLYQHIGVVFQETFLFAGSVYENIAYAKPTAKKEEVVSAAKVANAHEFIMKMPDTYETIVGENGYSLSGGERQRIAIARAILKNPAILILDEATSSLDVETESKIQEALARLIKGRTTIAIAHRLSTLRNANRLVVLEKGKLAEMGTHMELLKKQGIYYKLVMAQRQTTKMNTKSDEGVEKGA